MDLESFLTLTFDRYLFPDLDNMAKLVPNGSTGACVYPMIAASFAGVELLGALRSTEPYDPERGGRYFREYWQSCIYADEARQRHAELFYRLVRHGLAHKFATQGPVFIFKDDPERHLTERPGRQPPGWEIYFGAVQFADDLRRSYAATKSELLASTSAAERFREIVADEERTMRDCFAGVQRFKLEAAPQAQPPTMPSGTHQMYSDALKNKP